MCSAYFPYWTIQFIFLLYLVAFVIARHGSLPVEPIRYPVLSLQGKEASKYSPEFGDIHQEISSSRLVKRTSSGKNNPKVNNESPKAKPEGWLSWSSDSGSGRNRGTATESPEKSSARSPNVSAKGSLQDSLPGSQRGGPVRSSGCDSGGGGGGGGGGGRGGGSSIATASQGGRQDSNQIPDVGRGLTMPQGTREGKQKYTLPGAGITRYGRQSLAGRRNPRTRPPLDSRPEQPEAGQSPTRITNTLPARARTTSNAAAVPASANIRGRFAGVLSSAFQTSALKSGPRTSNLLVNRPYHSHEWWSENMVMNDPSRSPPAAAGISRPIHPIVRHQQPLLRNDQPLLQIASSRGSSLVGAGSESPLNKSQEATETNPRSGLASQQGANVQTGSREAAGGKPTKKEMLPPQPSEDMASAVPRRPRNPSEWIDSVARQPSTQQPGAAGTGVTSSQPDLLPLWARTYQLSAAQRALFLQGAGLISSGPSRDEPSPPQPRPPPVDQSTIKRAGQQQRPQTPHVKVAGSGIVMPSAIRQPSLPQSTGSAGETTAVQRSRHQSGLETRPSGPPSDPPNLPQPQGSPVEASAVQNQGIAFARGQPDLTQWTAPVGEPTAAQLSRYRQEMEVFLSTHRGNREGQPQPQPQDHKVGPSNRVVSGQPRHGWGVKDWPGNSR